MPATFFVDLEHRLGVVTLSGTVTTEEILEATFLLLSDLDWHPGFGVLYDGRRLETALVHPGDVESFTGLTVALYDRIGDGRTAWVYLREVDGLVAQHLFAQIKGPVRERRGFTRYDQAVAWLQGT